MRKKFFASRISGLLTWNFDLGNQVSNFWKDRRLICFSASISSADSYTEQVTESDGNTAIALDAEQTVVEDMQTEFKKFGIDPGINTPNAQEFFQMMNNLNSFQGYLGMNNLNPHAGALNMAQQYLPQMQNPGQQEIMKYIIEQMKADRAIKAQEKTEQKAETKEAKDTISVNQTGIWREVTEEANKILKYAKEKLDPKDYPDFVENLESKLKEQYQFEQATFLDEGGKFRQGKQDLLRLPHEEARKYLQEIRWEAERLKDEVDKAVKNKDKKDQIELEEKLKDQVELAPTASETLQDSLKDLNKSTAEAQKYGIDLGSTVNIPWNFKTLEGATERINFLELQSRTKALQQNQDLKILKTIPEELPSGIDRNSLVLELEIQALQKLVTENVNKLNERLKVFNRMVEEVSEKLKNLSRRPEDLKSLEQAESLYEFFSALGLSKEFLKSQFTEKERSKLLEEVEQVAERYKGIYSERSSIYANLQTAIYKEKTDFKHSEMRNPDREISKLAKKTGEALRLATKGENLNKKNKAEFDLRMTELNELIKKAEKTQDGIEAIQELRTKDGEGKVAITEISEEYVAEIVDSIDKTINEINTAVNTAESTEKNTRSTIEDVSKFLAESQEKTQAAFEKAQKDLRTNAEFYADAFAELADQGNSKEIKAVNNLLGDINLMHPEAKLSTSGNFIEKIKRIENFLQTAENAGFKARLENLKSKDSLYDLATQLQEVHHDCEMKLTEFKMKENKEGLTLEEMKEYKDKINARNNSIKEIIGKAKRKGLNVSINSLSAKQKTLKTTASKKDSAVNDFENSKQTLEVGINQKIKDLQSSLTKGKAGNSLSREDVESMENQLKALMDAKNDLRQRENSLDSKRKLSQHVEKNQLKTHKERKEINRTRIREALKGDAGVLKSIWLDFKHLGVFKGYGSHTRRYARWNSKMLEALTRMEESESTGMLSGMTAFYYKKKLQRAQDKIEKLKDTKTIKKYKGIENDEVSALRVEAGLHAMGIRPEDMPTAEELKAITNEVENAKKETAQSEKDFYDKEIKERFGTLSQKHITIPSLTELTAANTKISTALGINLELDSKNYSHLKENYSAAERLDLIQKRMSNLLDVRNQDPFLKEMPIDFVDLLTALYHPIFHNLEDSNSPETLALKEAITETLSQKNIGFHEFLTGSHLKSPDFEDLVESKKYKKAA